jgi:hypothetical protein
MRLPPIRKRTVASTSGSPEWMPNLVATEAEAHSMANRIPGSN